MAKLAPFALVEAFCTDQPHSGNPAGVVILDSWPSDEVLQGLASTINQAETAYVVAKRDGYDLRWFTPGVEVRLCGHATLATATYLNKLNPALNNFQFSTLSGKLSCRIENRVGELNFPVAEQIPDMVAPGYLREVFPDAPAIHAKGDDWFVELKSEAEVIAFQPDFAKIATCGLRGLSITARGSQTDFCYRFFAPQSGVDEDHATGSAQTYLVPYWADVLGKNQLSSLQLSNRKGAFESTLSGDRVQIRGKSNLLVEGSINIPD
ncbi:MAG: PhzF family phenazine biosynthesis protein [Fimbriimonadaceae bacterium]|nr:MAG: PhzF family phenazine biosynthesis protein [Fimbriimonadaceae bacterium]